MSQVGTYYKYAFSREQKFENTNKSNNNDSIRLTMLKNDSNVYYFGSNY